MLLRVIIIVLSIVVLRLEGYGVPSLNLGLTNFLDGGPVRPTPGWYFLQYFRYYTTNKFLDNRGQPLNNIPSPRFHYSAGVTQLVYQFKNPFLFGGKLGLDCAIPYILSSEVHKNLLGICSTGVGFGDLAVGTYLQWDPIFYKDRPLFVHRLEFDVFFPTGKFSSKVGSINPGSNIYFFNTYWAATFYITRRLPLSWRLQYAFFTKNKKIDFLAGKVIYGNYALAYQLTQRLFAGINGYFLQQLSNNVKEGLIVPNSKERVVGLGPGFVYFVEQELVLFGHAYFEFCVRNRTQGTSVAFSLIKHF